MLKIQGGEEEPTATGCTTYVLGGTFSRIGLGYSRWTTPPISSLISMMAGLDVTSRMNEKERDDISSAITNMMACLLPVSKTEQEDGSRPQGIRRFRDVYFMRKLVDKRYCALYTMVSRLFEVNWQGTVTDKIVSFPTDASKEDRIELL